MDELDLAIPIPGPHFGGPGTRRGCCRPGDGTLRLAAWREPWAIASDGAPSQTRPSSRRLDSAADNCPYDALTDFLARNADLYLIDFMVEREGLEPSTPAL